MRRDPHAVRDIVIMAGEKKILRAHRFILTIGLFLFVYLFSPWESWGSQDTAASPDLPSEPAVVAEGKDGFRVTAQDVQELAEFFTTHTMFQTTEQEYRRYTVQTFLFAREAERLGLAAQAPLPEVRIQRHLALANLYVDYRVQNLKLEPEAVQSYYRAFPERFLKDPRAEKWRSAATRFYGDEDVLSLEEAAPHIEAFMRRQLRKKVEASAFQELMAASGVVMK